MRHVEAERREVGGDQVGAIDAAALQCRCGDDQHAAAAMAPVSCQPGERADAAQERVPRDALLRPHAGADHRRARGGERAGEAKDRC
jgi:hypothetical protein